jgi:outer membrane protein TolC
MTSRLPSPAHPGPSCPLQRRAARSSALAALVGSSLLVAAVQTWAQPTRPARAAAVPARATPAPPPVPAPSAGARCPEDEPTDGVTPAPGAADAPRTDLKAMLDEALRRSDAVGAATLLAQAAELDVEEARAAVRPTVSLSLNAGVVGTRQSGLPDASGGQARAAVVASAPIYDGGRIGEITSWRRHLAEAARQGQLSAREQVALQTVSLAFERYRYRLQSQVYRQYSRKMACLVEALETIVTRDRGRQSELVQARKTQAQAELLRQQATSSLRQTEARLRRFVGDGLPPAEGLGGLMVDVPILAESLAAAEAAPEIAQLRAQADAQDSLTRAVAAGDRPQLSWVVSGSKAGGAGSPASVSAGVALTIPLFTPGVTEAVEASRKRAEAARLQASDLIGERRSRVAEVHEQATAAFDRARRTGEVLRDSERVRASTLMQWQQLGRRSLFDVMGAEADHYNLRVAQVNALVDGQQAVALLSSLAGGVRSRID